MDSTLETITYMHAVKEMDSRYSEISLCPLGIIIDQINHLHTYRGIIKCNPHQQTLHHLPTQHPLSMLGSQNIPPLPLRLHSTGHNTTNPQPKLMRKRLDQSHKGRLTGRIGQHIPAEDVPSNTTHINDGSVRGKQTRH